MPRPPRWALPGLGAEDGELDWRWRRDGTVPGEGRTHVERLGGLLLRKADASGGRQEQPEKVEETRMPSLLTRKGTEGPSLGET